ncbi:3-dehydroquinate synthase [Jeotgalibaca sp. A122]|uniref:3-dehydroquinate synthase n=1 Tax=Jeotgalibaca sp. A122 TaxID=3457322 RepID=UPI003FCF46A6
MSVLTVDVATEDIHYPLKIQKGLLNQLAEEIKSIYKNKKIAIVTDQNVYRFYGEQVVTQLTDAGFEIEMIILEPGEQAKSMENLQAIFSRLIAFGLSRSDLMIALGGGVIGDLAGFAAASYLRGIDFVQVPTTLLAQVDSSVGGKVAIDLPEGKNLVGAFYHPKLVVIDPEVLTTLADSTFNDGMAEVIKYGCIHDAQFFNQLKGYQTRAEVMADIEDVIAICCTIKRDLVQSDEKDTSERMLLNFGHTVGHAIEAYYHYEKYTHGQAISIGMVAINRLTEALGLSENGSTAAIEAILRQYQLPTELTVASDYKYILPLIKNDKKNIQNALFVVVLDAIGSSRTMAAPVDFFSPLLKGHES